MARSSRRRSSGSLSARNAFTMASACLAAQSSADVFFRELLIVEIILSLSPESVQPALLSTLPYAGQDEPPSRRRSQKRVVPFPGAQPLSMVPTLDLSGELLISRSCQTYISRRSKASFIVFTAILPSSQPGRNPSRLVLLNCHVPVFPVRSI